MNKIENNKITENNIHDYFLKKYELRYDNKIYLIGTDYPIFKLGNIYKFIPNGLAFPKIVEEKTSYSILLKDNLDAEALSYYNIEFEYVTSDTGSRWVIKEVYGESR